MRSSDRLSNQLFSLMLRSPCSGRLQLAHDPDQEQGADQGDHEGRDDATVAAHADQRQTVTADNCLCAGWQCAKLDSARFQACTDVGFGLVNDGFAIEAVENLLHGQLRPGISP